MIKQSVQKAIELHSGADRQKEKVARIGPKPLLYSYVRDFSTAK
jgi:hypothetical protein